MRVLLFLAAVAGVQAGGGARVHGEVRLGALFAVHGAPAAAAAGGATCGAVREHYGIQRVEATLQALDEIAAGSLLPGLRLGADLRDSCWAPPTALRQTIDLIRDAIPSHDASDSCGRDTGARPPLLGVLGPGASAAAAQVQNLLQLFAIPQISYSATARELSDRGRFATFFRVVPSDRHQARLLRALLQAHNWTYVHTIHTDESYGQSGMASFREEAARSGVCVAREEALRAAPEPSEVDEALGRLMAGEGGGTQVAVCWCEGRTARALLAGLARREGRGAGGKLRLVASDGWADRGDVVAGLEHAALGSLTVRIRSPYLRDFDGYYHALRPHTNHRNPWFKEFWEQKFNCSLSENLPQHTRRCTGTESLAAGYTQEPKLALVVRGVFALAHALRDMREALCPPSPAGSYPPRPPLCPVMLPFNVSLYRRYLSRVRFRAPDGGLVAFDENGDPPPELSEYDVMTLSGSSSLGYRYTRVGRWRGGSLHLRGGSAAAARRALGWRGACSAPCRAGHFARGGRCCWTCVPCKPHEITRKNGCRACPPGTRPNGTRTVCVPSPVEWGGAAGARHSAGAAGGAGLVAITAFTAVLWRHRSTPVVKSASRELCALLLAAAMLCHISAIAASVRPNLVSCALVRLAAPSLSGVYASLLLRTARVARLVAGGPRPSLVSSRAAVAGWAALVAPGTAAAGWAVLYWGAAPRIIHPTRARSVLTCGGENAAAQLVPLAPALALLLACTALAIRTRRLPHNFNETRFLGAAAYATCVTWAAFAPVYAAASGGARTSALCGGVSLSASGAALLALGPRVFVCVCRPQRNTRAHFLTASIRCHLGKYRPDAATAAAAAQQKKRVVCRDAGVQAGTGGAEGGEVCTAVGTCARVTQDPRGAGEDLTVTIALLHHRHVTLEPDIFLYSRKNRRIVLVELTVPWETNIPKDHAIKLNKYYDLTNELTKNGYAVNLYAVEVGARGIPAKSLYNLLKDLGLSNTSVTSIIERTSKAALVGSYKIWLGREEGSEGERVYTQRP